MGTLREPIPRLHCMAGIGCLLTSRHLLISSGTPRIMASFRNGTTVTASKPVEAAILNKLTQKLNPVHLQVVNESFVHNVPKGSETHFKVLVVSDSFSSLPLIKRHRLVNSALQEELNSGVHALSIVAKTPEQWNEGEKVERSPDCRGGFGK